MRPPCRLALRTLGLRRAHSRPNASTLDFVPASSPISSLALERMQDFVSRSKRLFTITGAGLSTESGIPDYRSEGVGLYARTDRRPIQHAEFVRSASARQRYWARNYVGWPQFSSRLPNAAHLAFSGWEAQGKLHWLVTQNVDALHSKAGQRRLTELHGCAHRRVKRDVLVFTKPVLQVSSSSKLSLPDSPHLGHVPSVGPYGPGWEALGYMVVCLGCGALSPRQALQTRLEALNPGWAAEAGGVAPDGDVFLTDEQVRHFRVPSCEACGGTLKPDVTFFGDTVHRDTVGFIHERLAESDGVLVAGSSLQVYSGYRFLLAAREREIPVAILNIGATRADHLAALRVNARCGEVLPAILPL